MRDDRPSPNCQWRLPVTGVLLHAAPFMPRPVSKRTNDDAVDPPTHDPPPPPAQQVPEPGAPGVPEWWVLARLTLLATAVLISACPGANAAAPYLPARPPACPYTRPSDATCLRPSIARSLAPASPHTHTHPHTPTHSHTRPYCSGSRRSTSSALGDGGWRRGWLATRRCSWRAATSWTGWT